MVTPEQAKRMTKPQSLLHAPEITKYWHRAWMRFVYNCDYGRPPICVNWMEG
jgi:hypothetical protein